MKFTKDEIKKFNTIIAEATKAATKAGEGAKPTPMFVYETTSVFDSSQKPGTKGEVVNEGVCGFACLKFNGRGKFAGYLKEKGLASKGVYGGLHMSSYTIYDNFTQSYERKTKAVYAAADVFTSHGIKCYAESRLD